jgi:hypothetical protein
MKAKYLYEKGKGRESMEKYWKDRKKEKSDQRRKGFKPSFNRNNPNKNQQDQSAKDESKKEEDHQSNVGGAGKITYPWISLTEEIK